MTDLTATQRYRMLVGHILRMHRQDGWVGDVDGGWLQDTLVELGFLERFDVPRGGCGGACMCAEGDWCYRLSRLGRAASRAAERTEVAR